MACVDGSSWFQVHFNGRLKESSWKPSHIKVTTIPWTVYHRVDSSWVLLQNKISTILLKKCCKSNSSKYRRCESLCPKKSLSCVFFTSCPFPSHPPSAPPQPPPGAQPVDGGEKETQAGPSGEEGGGGGGEENGAEEKQSSLCCKVKTPWWLRACVHYRFPASIDPFTSENPVKYTALCHLPYFAVETSLLKLLRNDVVVLDFTATLLWPTF